ncbi:MAG: cellulase family glycosylhydrolase [Ginsengibacter sp.]
MQIEKLKIKKGFFNNSFRFLFLLAITVFFILLFVQGYAQGYLRVDGKRVVNDNGNVLLRGIGLGGWMLQEGYMLNVHGPGQQHKIRERIEELLSPQQTQEFYDTWLSNHTRKIDIDSLRSWGFNSVRLPMHYNLFTRPVEMEEKGKNTWLEKGFDLTDSLLSWCKQNRMYLVLDLHAAPGGQGNDLNIADADSARPSLWISEQNQQKTIELWKKLAHRYANEPWIGGYDILNEPNFGFTDSENDPNGIKEKNNEPLRKLMVAITKAIREEDKNHIIIIEGNGWGNNYNGVLPVWDQNMVLSFHKYWNLNDQASIQKMLDIREKNNLPVWLGETGENSNVWYTQAVRLLEKNNIGWAWWPLKKMGANNPLEIKTNPNYEDLLRYWNGKGPKPKESNVYSGLLELATYTKLETNSFHKDVIDALFRQPESSTAKPYKKNIIGKNSLLNAVDYDLGRNGIAYLDHDTANYKSPGATNIGNKRHVYRNDGVDIRIDSSGYESFYVSDFEAGEWLQYGIDVRQKGMYKVLFTVSSDADNTKISFSNQGEKFGKNIKILNTGKNNWKTAGLKGVALNKGKQIIRIECESGGLNLKSILFILMK